MELVRSNMRNDQVSPSVHSTKATRQKSRRPGTFKGKKSSQKIAQD